ncbi:MAG: cation diffusion facilitator family transporter, partial [Bdellovibrionota bacterium]
PIMAFAVAGYIFWISLTQVRVALGELSDQQLPESEIRLIRGILDSFQERAIEAHDLRTRKSGAVRHIDFHLVCCGQMTVEESHSVCDELEGKLMGAFPNASVNIHVEPCESAVTQCCLNCPIYTARHETAGFKSL